MDFRWVPNLLTGVQPVEGVCVHISVNKEQDAVKCMKTGKAAGILVAVAEMLKSARCLDLLTQLDNHIINKGSIL